jgi:hypothetical protein
MVKIEKVNAAGIYCHSGTKAVIFCDFVYKNAILKVR